MRKLKRQDGDPLDVTPHERFEIATRTPDAIRPYEEVVAQMARAIMNETARVGPYAVFRDVQEVVYRMSTVYHVPRARVEQDIVRAQAAQINAAVWDAADNGLLVDRDDTTKRLPLREHVHVKKLVSKTN